jgi:hypothetical protein
MNAEQPQPASSPAAINGRLTALAAQRDQAMNLNAILTGELAHLHEELKVAHARIKELESRHGGEFATEGARESSPAIVR